VLELDVLTALEYCEVHYTVIWWYVRIQGFRFWQKRKNWRNWWFWTKNEIYTFWQKTDEVFLISDDRFLAVYLCQVLYILQLLFSNYFACFLFDRLPCSFVTHQLLGSYIVQSEFGDYDIDEHGDGIDYIKQIKFVPGQTEELLEKISKLHDTNRCVTIVCFLLCVADCIKFMFWFITSVILLFMVGLFQKLSAEIDIVQKKFKENLNVQLKLWCIYLSCLLFIN